MRKSRTMRWPGRLLISLLVGVPLGSLAFQSGQPPIRLTSEQDHQRTMGLLRMTEIRPGKSGNNSAPDHANYDPAKANPFPKLPDPLTLKNGKTVTKAADWWSKRRPEIVEDFDREVYGRVPKNVPKVAWHVEETTPGKNGDIDIVTKRLVGTVDNSSYPDVKVEIGLTLTLPANTKGPAPVVLLFGGGGFPGAGRGGTGAANAGQAGPPYGPSAFSGRGAGGAGLAPSNGARAGTAAAAGSPAGGTAGRGAPPTAGTARDGVPANAGVAPGRGGTRGGAPPAGPGAGRGPSPQQQILEKGWGYASLNTGSVQADDGAGFTLGIIGLVNKGQPRGLEDWGVLRAWAWGASKALDYFETDSMVDAKHVALKATRGGAKRPSSPWLMTNVFGQSMRVPPAKAAQSCTAAIGARQWRI